MFKDGLRLEDVVIELDIESPIVLCYYQDYIKLVNMARLVTIYKESKGDLSLFLGLYERIKQDRLNKPQIAQLLKNPKPLWNLRGWRTCITTTFGICTQKKNRWKMSWRKRKRDCDTIVYIFNNGCLFFCRFVFDSLSYNPLIHRSQISHR